jgi:O-antigen/teichoic acid export membrane protein/aminoglycoside phosphotransferase
VTAGQFVVVTRQRLAGIWREPLARTGHLLIVSSMLNAGTGVGYWLVAARLNPPAVVGINSAAIAAMMLLAGIAQLNLMSTILRFVPTSGAAAGPLIRGAYLVASGLSGLAAIGFLVGLRLWAPHLAGLLGTGLTGAGFVIATMGWSMFVMQDSALVAVRRPAMVPTENTTFALLKIVLVVVLSLAVPGMGIWLSWTAAMLLAVAFTTTYLFWRAIPAFVAASTPGTAQVASLRELCRFAGPDYVGAVAWIACVSLVPLLVLDLTNPRQSAAFSLAWQICLALYAVPSAFGQSLVAHGAAQQDLLDKYHRKALQQSLALLVLVVPLVIAFAPVGLRFFGAWYVIHGTAPLRLLALSALPNAIVALEVSRARVTRRMRTVVAVLVGLCALVLSLTVILVPRVGILGGGIAWLAAQTLVASALVGYRQAGAIRSRLVRPAEPQDPSMGVRAALASGNWQPEHDLPTVTGTAVIMVRGADSEPCVLKVAISRNGIAGLRRERDVLYRLQADKRLGEWRSLVPVPMGSGDISGGCYLVTSRLPGTDGRNATPGLVNWLTPAAVNAIAPLHRLDSTVQVINRVLLHKLVDEPVGRLREVVRRKQAADRLAASLHAALAGRWVTLGWTHGDFCPGNVLVSTDGRVTGIVDWGRIRDHDLVILDLAFWLLKVPRPGQPHEFGARIAARLGTEHAWMPAERQLLETRTYGDPISGRALLLLAWLRHVTDSLTKNDHHADISQWSRRHVLPVLRMMDGFDGTLKP